MIENIYNPIEDLVSDFLGQFIESHKQELCDEDYGLIDAIVTIIISSVPKSSKINTDRICENIKDNFNDNYQFTNESEIVSNTIRDTGAYLYFNLTDDIRDKIVKELTPHLPDLLEAAKKLGLFDEVQHWQFELEFHFLIHSANQIFQTHLVKQFDQPSFLIVVRK